MFSVRYITRKVLYGGIIWACVGVKCEPAENIYTKTCRMDKEFTEQELDRTKKALDVIKKEMSKETIPDFAVIHNALKGVSDE